MVSYGDNTWEAHGYPSKKNENLPINLLILCGRILEFGSISQQLAHIDYPPTTRLRKATSNRHLWCVPSPQNFRPHLWEEEFLVLPLYMIFGVYIYIYLLYVYLFWHIFWVHVLIHQPWNWGYCLSPIANWQPWEIIYLFISYLFGMCHRLTSTESLCRLATQHIQMVLHLCTSSLLP